MRDCFRSAIAVTSTTVSPYWARIAPSACRAMRPVSRTSFRPANSFSILCAISSFFSFRSSQAYNVFGLTHPGRESPAFS